MTNIFRFHPYLQPTLWGGRQIALLKGFKEVDDIGESWEISGVEHHETVVDGGPYSGLPLNTLVAQLKEQLMGNANYQRFGNRFPLLIKFIDAQQDLSIQVHPDDETAHRHGKPMGKTEMWYVLPSAKGARLYNGLNTVVSPEQLATMVEQKTITRALAPYEVQEGDVFFIPPGRIHAIGAGCMIAEIQQTSDITYRIYDYDRRDNKGCPRELHVEQAAACIDYHVMTDYRTHYTTQTNKPVPVVRCPHFHTSVLEVNGQAAMDYTNLDSFVILIGVRGQGTVTVDGQTAPIALGQTLLLPAISRQVTVSGHLRLLETYVNP